MLKSRMPLNGETFSYRTSDEQCFLGSLVHFQQVSDWKNAQHYHVFSKPDSPALPPVCIDRGFFFRHVEGEPKKPIIAPWAAGDSGNATLLGDIGLGKPQ